jgi:two-component system NtrC family sensor kinase
MTTITCESATRPAAPVVLLVDDQATNLILLRGLLRPEYQVLEAESGAQALALAAASPRPDLILLDIMMPDMDGYEVLRRLRAEPTTCSIPVIFVTAMTEENDERVGLTLGAVDYLTKPFRSPILLARVRTQLELKQGRDALQVRNDSLEAAVQQRTQRLSEALAQQRELNQRLEQAQLQLLQSEKMASLGQFAAGVAHEINNPIGFVRSNLGTLKTYFDDLMAVLQAGDAVCQQAGVGPTVAEYRRLCQDTDLGFLRQDLVQVLDESREGLDRVSRIVADLKHFSRFGREDWAWADLHEGLHTTLRLMAAQLPAGCQVQLDLAADLPLVNCIAPQLHQVFLNLLTNAVQALRGSGCIRIVTRRLDGAQVELRFEDSGPGIAAEHLGRIFDPFFTTQAVGQGMGLGLSISWGIVHRHAGLLSAHNRAEGGACFVLQLPLDPQAALTQPGHRAGPATPLTLHTEGVS